MGSLGGSFVAVNVPDNATPSAYGNPGELVLKNHLSALVVDPSETVRKVHRAFLGMFGVETVVVEDGMDAIRLVESGMAFNLILIDMDLPVMDGPSTTRVLRAMGFRNKIVAFTTRDSEREKLYFMEAGLDHYHEKPMTYAKLIPILREIDDAL